MEIKKTVASHKFEKSLSELSPFEIKGTLIELANTDAKKSTRQFLNAGRGNPNWVATTPRDAFFLLGQFAMTEARRIYEDTSVGLAGIPASESIADRFETFIKENISTPGAKFLSEAYAYEQKLPDAQPDDIVHEWVEGILGDQYPTPDRILKYTQLVLREYLALEMGDGKDMETVYDLFATEGGTAGMCYAFDSLARNKLVNKGDRIALMSPIFTPYIEIPELDRFSFDVVTISANSVDDAGFHHWQYPKEEIDKLRDKSIKLVCLVNPSNPPSYEMSPETVAQIVDVVKNDNPDLMIITDDVYGTFVDGFRSLMYELPHNTMCVYSFSKYFGATGWRLAVIAMRHDDNIFDKLIARLPEQDKVSLNRRYESLTTDPAKMKFIDRMVADSRMVALNHTAGLSTPQQIQMELFALASILDKEKAYKKRMIQLIHQRLNALWETTGFTLSPDPLRAGYYSQIDIMVWAKKIYGDEFAKWLSKSYEPLDFVIRLAKETAVVLLNGDGFDGPLWSVRASLANLDTASYLKIGKAIRSILDQYYSLYKTSGSSTKK
ncbi:MAG: bifunctional aspartate transaminase/aspartate 4-decarboxylase [Muribaculaceae bacterium]|nr:bifunctional aspartate transaminase/aspartate 4-decarboxylase [Muribaculaceae bacterium]